MSMVLILETFLFLFSMNFLRHRLALTCSLKNPCPCIIEQSLRDIVALDPNEIRPRTLSGSKESKPDYLRHKRSKSTDNKLDDLGFAVDPRTPSSIKANSFPRSSPLTLNKKGIVYMLGQ